MYQVTAESSSEYESGKTDSFPTCGCPVAKIEPVLVNNIYKMSIYLSLELILVTTKNRASTQKGKN
jgi:hypothetical protein